jgi:multiple RNA-binding domain-containing protein 1
VPQNHGSAPKTVSDTSAAKVTDQEKSLKRKRDVPADDPKLKEYLHVMQPPSKFRIYEDPVDDTYENTETQHSSVANNDQAAVPENPTTANDNRDTDTDGLLDELFGDFESDGQPEDPDEVSEQPTATTNIDTVQNVNVEQQNSVSDMDWLRMRTNRTLDLVEDDQNVSVHASLPTGQPDDDGLDDLFEEASATLAAPANANSSEIVTESTKDKDIETLEENGRLFIRNLPYSTTESELQQVFAVHGEIVEVSPHLSFFCTCFAS